MKTNMVARIRTLSNIAITLVMVAFVLALAISGKDLSPAWIWILGGVAGAGILAQLVTSVVFRDQINAAWDEQAVELNRNSYAFGYWVAMATFLSFFALIQFDLMRSSSAFFLLAPALVAPAAYMAFAALRGRTD